MPRRHLEEIIRPNIVEYKREYGNLRLCFNAVASVDALMGHLYFWCLENAEEEVLGIKDDSQFRHKLGEQHPDLLLLRDIAKAQKHARLKYGDPQISLTSQIAQGDIGWGEGGFGEGRYGGKNQIIVEFDDGYKRVVETVLKNALEYLEVEMKRLNVPEI